MGSIHRQSLVAVCVKDTKLLVVTDRDPVSSLIKCPVKQQEKVQFHKCPLRLFVFFTVINTVSKSLSRGNNGPCSCGKQRGTGVAVRSPCEARKRRSSAVKRRKVLQKKKIFFNPSGGRKKIIKRPNKIKSFKRSFSELAVHAGNDVDPCVTYDERRRSAALVRVPTSQNKNITRR